MGRRILVVEDEPLIAGLIADWLVEMEHEVVGTVNTTAAALQIANRTPPDAALLDVTLGAGDSFVLADELLAKGIAVAFITGHDTQSLPERFRQAPILGKPFDFDAMQSLLDRLIGPATVRNG